MRTNAFQWTFSVYVETYVCMYNMYVHTYARFVFHNYVIKKLMSDIWALIWEESDSESRQNREIKTEILQHNKENKRDNYLIRRGEPFKQERWKVVRSKQSNKHLNVVPSFSTCFFLYIFFIYFHHFVCAFRTFFRYICSADKDMYKSRILKRIRLFMNAIRVYKKSSNGRLHLVWVSSS